MVLAPADRFQLRFGVILGGQVGHAVHHGGRSQGPDVLAFGGACVLRIRCDGLPGFRPGVGGPAPDAAALAGTGAIDEVLSRLLASPG